MNLSNKFREARLENGCLFKKLYRNRIIAIEIVARRFLRLRTWKSKHCEKIEKEKEKKEKILYDTVFFRRKKRKIEAIAG